MLQTNTIVRRPRKKFSDADFKRAADEQIQLLSALALFVDVDADSKEERIRKSISDPFFFFRTYLQHYFADEPADWHGEFVDLLMMKDQQVAVTAFRGGAKSTYIFGEVIREMCLWGKIECSPKFIVYMLDSKDKAAMYTQRILIELQHNERIKADFGLRVSMDAAIGDFFVFNPESFRTQTRLVAYGEGMSMRGLVTAETRPDWLIVEDLQDDEAAESERRTKKTLRYLLKGARNALIPQGWRMHVVGNVITNGSLMDELLHPKKHLGFLKRKYLPEIINKLGIRVATWAKRFPLTLLDKIKSDIGEVAYRAEYLCEPVESGEYFDENRDIHHWKSLPPDLKLEGNTIMQVDPSFSAEGDCTAIGVGVPYSYTTESKDFGKWCDTNDKAFGVGEYNIILDLYNRQNTVDEMILEVYRLFRMWNPVVIYVDGSVEQEIVFERFFAEYEKTHGKLPIIWQDFSESKDLRIRALQPYMQRRRVPLPPATSKDVGTTVIQFLRYGKPKVPDDGPDMLAALNDHLDSGVSAPGNVEML